jgi:hypothetical protein
MTRSLKNTAQQWWTKCTIGLSHSACHPLPIVHRPQHGLLTAVSYPSNSTKIWVWKKSTLPLSSCVTVFSLWTLKMGKPPPWAFKTFVLAPWRVISGFQKCFIYLFRLNFFIVNHRKIINGKSNFVGLHVSRSIQWTYNMVCFTIIFLSMFFCN